MAPPQIVVVGAGIVGASIAWHLTARGAAVTVLEAGAAGGAATAASFAWINATAGNPEPYFRLRLRSMAEWRRLHAEVPALPLSWCGGLCWDLERAALEAYAREHGGWGYGVRRVDRAAAARIEPALADPPEFALHVAEEGAVEPAPAAVALLDDAVARGARLVPRCEVRGLVESKGRIAGVATGDGPIAADEVVLAAGAATPALAATAGVAVALATPPGLLVHSRPHARLLNGLVMMPELHMRQTIDGRIVSAADFGGMDPGADAAATVRAVFAATRAKLKGAARLVLDFHTIGLRPTPADEFPIAGRAPGRPGLYVAVMHSGVTLAPAIGLFAAEELLEGRRDPLLARYGMERFG